MKRMSCSKPFETTRELTLTEMTISYSTQGNFLKE